jgi:NADPH:quinone reductase
MAASSPKRAARTQRRSGTWPTRGSIKPRVHAELPLEVWRNAFDLLGHREVVDKAVIRPDL